MYGEANNYCYCAYYLEANGSTGGLAGVGVTRRGKQSQTKVKQTDGQFGGLFDEGNSMVMTRRVTRACKQRQTKPEQTD